MLPKPKRRPYNRTPVRTASKTLQQIFGIMERQEVTQRSMAKGLKTDKAQMQKYKRGDQTPNILRVEEMADLLGYELVLRRKQ